MSPLIRRKKTLTQPSEQFTVFIMDDDETKEIGRFDDLEEAKKVADESSSEEFIGFVYSKDNRVVFSTLRWGEYGKLWIYRIRINL